MESLNLCISHLRPFYKERDIESSLLLKLTKDELKG